MRWVWLKGSPPKLLGSYVRTKDDYVAYAPLDDSERLAVKRVPASHVKLLSQAKTLKTLEGRNPNWRFRLQMAAYVAVILVLGSYLYGVGPQWYWHSAVDAAESAYYDFKYGDPPCEGGHPDPYDC
jgi:hypothetical protein